MYRTAQITCLDIALAARLLADAYEAHVALNVRESVAPKTSRAFVEGIAVGESMPRAACALIAAMEERRDDRFIWPLHTTDEQRDRRFEDVVAAAKREIGERIRYSVTDRRRIWEKAGALVAASRLAALLEGEK